jgi:hypothetical protein
MADADDDEQTRIAPGRPGEGPPRFEPVERTEPLLKMPALPVEMGGAQPVLTPPTTLRPAPPEEGTPPVVINVLLVCGVLTALGLLALIYLKL